MRQPFVYGITYSMHPEFHPGLTDEMRKELKALLTARYNTQVRVIVKAKTKKRMIELLKEADFRPTRSHFDNYGSVTGNVRELEVSKDAEEGVWVTHDYQITKFVRII